MADLFEGERTAPPNTPRPNRCSSTVVARVAQELTAEVVAWLEQVNRKRDASYVTADLLNALRDGSFDGYDLAKYLDRRGWDSVDAELVEILNSASSL